LQVDGGPGNARHADRTQAAAEGASGNESSLRGILRGFGLKVGKTTRVHFEGRIKELVTGHPSLETVASALLSVRRTLRRELDDFEKRPRAMARTDTRTRLLMTTPGVGVIVALTFACAIDDPSRFKSSKAVGALFGLTPTRYQSRETDYSGRISKNGDGSVRAVLYEAGRVILTRPIKGCTALKSWAMRIAKRAGVKKATVALARKLAVIMHRMLADGTPFTNQPAQRRARRRQGRAAWRRWPQGAILDGACARRSAFVAGRDEEMDGWRSNKGIGPKEGED
jgi:hypothetical protein